MLEEEEKKGDTVNRAQVADKVKLRLNERIGGSDQVLSCIPLGPAGMGDFILPFVLVKVVDNQAKSARHNNFVLFITSTIPPAPSTSSAATPPPSTSTCVG